MTTSYNFEKTTLVKHALSQGGSIHPLVIPADQTGGTGLLNPSVYMDNGKLRCIIRHVNYTLYHSENNKFEHEYGPLQYLHPEDDRTLTTTNYLAELNDDVEIQKIRKIDTSLLDVKPLWTFVGLEDARLFRWEDKLYACGVRRDTTTHGEGRMELSELNEYPDGTVREISRIRMPTPGHDSYCEKNWMPILDKPYHFIKWTNPTEVVHFDIKTKTTTVVHLEDKKLPNVPETRGGSHIVRYGDYYIGLTHEVLLFNFDIGRKNGIYKHRFILWDKDFNMIRMTPTFTFMGAKVEFCCGAAWHKNGNLLVSFGFQDNCAFIVQLTEQTVRDLVGL